MRSTAEALEQNKIKLSVEVDEDELRSALDETIRRLQKEVSVPGFRPGKVPRRLLEVRLGDKAIREELIRHAVPDYYAQAVEDAALDIIAVPAIDITAGEQEGPLSFDAVVEVRPKVAIPGYEGLQVTLDAPEASDEEVDAQIDRLRENFAELTEVDRPIKGGDVVTLDISGLRGDEIVEEMSSTDYVHELGRGMLVEGADEKLHGAKTGDIVEVAASDAPGGEAKIRLLVKQVREKVLPDADDAWASDASEFDTIAELRDDLRGRIGAVKRLQANVALRERAVEALAALVVDEVSETLVDEEALRMQHGLLHRLADRGIPLDQYLAATDQDAEQVVAELRRQAEGEVRADLALRALADAEGLEVTDDELADELSRAAEESGRPVREVARQIAEGAGLERLRSELRTSKAVAWLIGHVDVVDDHGQPIDQALLVGHESLPEQAGEGEADTTASTDEEGQA
ncbi:MAG: trigger factor [Acidimicrobiales bacterium]